MPSVQRKSIGLFGMVVFLAGCQGVLPPPEPPPHQGANVRVACPRGLAGLIRSQSRVWEAAQQATVTVQEYDPAQGPAAVPNADIWLVAPAEMPRWAAAGR